MVINDLVHVTNDDSQLLEKVLTKIEQQISPVESYLGDNLYYGEEVTGEESEIHF